MERVIAYSRLGLFLATVLLLTISCGTKIKGTFLIDQDLHKYMIDTTVRNFQMVDQFGITEEFYTDDYVWYQDHLYLSMWGIDGEAFGQTYGIAYHSTLNNYFLTYVFRADVDYTRFEVEWNQKDWMIYNFGKDEFSGEIKPELSFYDTYRFNNQDFTDVIKIDYSKIKGQIDTRTPLITYFSGQLGLVQIQTQEGVVLNRKMN